MTLYHMPVGFGPSQGPRQKLDGSRWTDSEHKSETVSIDFLTDPDLVQAVLPPGFRTAERPRVAVRGHFLTDIAWLAGRGYNYIEVAFEVVHQGKQETHAELTAVMWESRPEPIWFGREGPGHPKLFADVADLAITPDGTRVGGSWEGFTFATMTLPELTPDRVVPGAAAGASAAGPPLPKLNYKYWPRSEDMDRAALAEVVRMSTPPIPHTVVEHWTGHGEVAFNRATFEQLPTMEGIVNGLADLPVLESLGARYSRHLGVFDDIRDRIDVLD